MLPATEKASDRLARGTTDCRSPRTQFQRYTLCSILFTIIKKSDLHPVFGIIRLHTPHWSSPPFCALYHLLLPIGPYNRHKIIKRKTNFCSHSQHIFSLSLSLSLFSSGRHASRVQHYFRIRPDRVFRSRQSLLVVRWNESDKRASLGFCFRIVEHGGIKTFIVVLGLLVTKYSAYSV